MSLCHGPRTSALIRWPLMAIFRAYCRTCRAQGRLAARMSFDLVDTGGYDTKRPRLEPAPVESPAITRPEARTRRLATNRTVGACPIVIVGCAVVTASTYANRAHASLLPGLCLLLEYASQRPTLAAITGQSVTLPSAAHKRSPPGSFRRFLGSFSILFAEAEYGAPESSLTESRPLVHRGHAAGLL